MNNTSLCDAAVYIAEDYLFKSVLLSRIILSVIAVVLILALLCNQGPYLEYHKNARILLLSHHFSVLLQGVATIALHSADLLKFSSYEEPCDLLTSGTRCQLLRYPVTITYYTTIWTQFMMAIERVVATRLFHTYERTGALLGYTLALLQAGTFISLKWR
uniref:Uncharacterized protein n=1 Tax=Plectus sambesii TaxID=2011161 RepID=A0A914UXB4_9BILA